jgi:hypothetical protein
LSPLCTIYVNDRPLPSALGTLSGSEFLSARGPGWNGAGDFYFLAGEVLAERMFITGLVNDDTAGSASVIWSFAPIP